MIMSLNLSFWLWLLCYKSGSEERKKERLFVGNSKLFRSQMMENGKLLKPDFFKRLEVTAEIQV